MNNPDLVPLLPVPAPPPILPPLGFRRPGWATAIGVIAIVFAGIGILSPLLTVLSEHLRTARTQEVLTRIFPHWYLTFSHVAQIPALALSALMLAGGIQLLRCRPVARPLLLVYGWAAIAMVILDTVLVVCALAGLDTSSMNSLERAAYVGGIIGGVAGIVLGMAYPVFVVIWFARRKIMNQMAGWANPPG